MNHLAIILLGSNLGDRLNNLTEAEACIKTFASSIELISKTYRSTAWGKTDQPDFLNKVISIKTNLIPTELLNKLLEAEQKLKRERLEKWGPRTIDLDLLFFDDLVYADDNLLIPHPGIASRRFTLIPLCELYHDFLHPIYGVTLQQLLDNCTDQGKVEIFETENR
ncbi:MAG: 2-amino-4-hydroxy-6-hydroxymethyldihydropteridine diphosphokinase [Bacteroidetes bacterium]|nr:2-amino-4-hydroxy-6-hydroxymethyldihydropteridine diphosphokinase [Bacteroidota bacterium]